MRDAPVAVAIVQGQQEEREAQIEQKSHQLVMSRAQQAALAAYNRRLHQRIANATAMASESPDAHMHALDAPGGDVLKSYPIATEASLVSEASAQFGEATTGAKHAIRGPAVRETTVAPQPLPHTVGQAQQSFHLLQGSGVQRGASSGIYEPYEAPARRPLSSMSYSVGVTYRNLLDAAHAFAAPSDKQAGEEQGIVVRFLVLVALALVIQKLLALLHLRHCLDLVSFVRQWLPQPPQLTEKCRSNSKD